MSYTYGMKSAPAVGGGLGGLPNRAKIGEIRQFPVAPSKDWLPCNGAVYLKSAYPELAEKLPRSYYGATSETFTPVSDIILDMACGENNGESAFSLTLNSNLTYVFYVQGGRYTSGNYILSGPYFPATLRYLGGGKWIAIRSPAAGSTSSYISYDNARTWTANASAVASIWGGACGDEKGNIYIACNDGTSSYLQKSINNGASWTTKTTVGSPSLPTQNCICYVGNGVLFFVYATGSVRVSYDYGETWSFFNQFAPINNTTAAMYSNGNGVIFAKGVNAGNGILAASYDYGATWVTTPFQSRNSTDLNVVCSYGSNTWTVTTVGLGAFISTDNAKSFNGVGTGSDTGSLKYGATTNDASYVYSISVGTGRISYLGNAFSVPSISGTNQYIKAR